MDALRRDSFKCLGCLSPFISSYFTLIFLASSISPSLFSILLSHYILFSPSPPPPPFGPLFWSLSLCLFTYHCVFVLLCHLSSSRNTAASRPLRVSIPGTSLKVKNHLHVTFLSSIVYHPQGLEVMSSIQKYRYLLYSCMSVDEVVLQKTILHLCNEAC